MPKRSPITAALRRLATENMTLKIVSIVAAIVLFSIVRGAEDAQRSMFVDVVAILPPAEGGKVLVSEVPDRIKLTLEGSRSLLNAIRREDLEVQMDLTDADLRYYYFDPAAFDLPAGVRIVQMAPASVPLTWADRIERRVPIEAQIYGNLPPGLSVEEVSVAPGRVLLRGPRNEVDPLSSVETQPIDVTGLDPGQHVRRVRLERAPPHSGYVGEPMIEVRFQIVRELEERRLEELELSAVGAGRVQSIRPGQVTVLLRGTRASLAQLDPEAVLPWVQLPEDAEGTVALPVQVRGLPPGVEVVRVDPAEALVAVRPRAD